MDGGLSHDRKVIACNLLEPTKVGATGALCYVSLTNPGNGNDRIEVVVRSRSGRWVQKWEDMRRLGNFRIKTLPPEHPHYADKRLCDYNIDEYLAQLTQAHKRVWDPPHA